MDPAPADFGYDYWSRHFPGWEVLQADLKRSSALKDFIQALVSEAESGSADCQELINLIRCLVEE